MHHGFRVNLLQIVIFLVSLLAAGISTGGRRGTPLTCKPPWHVTQLPVILVNGIMMDHGFAHIEARCLVAAR